MKNLSSNIKVWAMFSKIEKQSPLFFESTDNLKKSEAKSLVFILPENNKFIYQKEKNNNQHKY